MDEERLAGMINQIARNLAVRGDAAAAEATARHVRDFWDPRMIAALRATRSQSLSPIARLALARLDADATVSK